jgi:1-acyl-sn-glycerol-3-phosphate acyltransferase
VIDFDRDLYPLKQKLGPVYWLYRGLRTILALSCFAGFWGGAVIVGWLWMPFLLLYPGTRIEKMHRVQRTMRHGYMLFHWWMKSLRLFACVTPAKAARPNGVPVTGPCVLIANHPTLCDVTSIASLFPNVVAVVRMTIAKFPLLRFLLEWAGCVPAGTRVLVDCEERLKQGFDVLIFPEGTRSPFGANSLQPFHRGAFELAARANVPIVLIKLTCIPPALGKKLPVWKVADHTAVLTVEPVDMIYPVTNSKALCAEIEQRYYEMLGYSVPAVAPAFAMREAQ